MKCDFYADHLISTTDEVDFCVKGEGDFTSVEDWYVRCKLLSQCLLKGDSIKTHARGEKIYVMSKDSSNYYRWESAILRSKRTC